MRVPRPPNDIWAASEYGRYVLHWDGHRWRVARKWGSGQITGLIAISAARRVGLRQLGHRGPRDRDVALRRQVLAVESPGLAGSVYRRQRRLSPGYLGHRRQPGLAVHRALQRDHVASRRTPAARSLACRRATSSRSPTGTSGSSATRRPGLEPSAWCWRTGPALTGRRLVSRLHAWAGRLAPGPHGGVLMTATPTGASATGLILVASPAAGARPSIVRSGLGSGVSDVAPGAPHAVAVGDRRHPDPPRRRRRDLAHGRSVGPATIRTTSKDTERGQIRPGLCSWAAAASSWARSSASSRASILRKVVDARLRLHLSRREQRAAVLVR